MPKTLTQIEDFHTLIVNQTPLFDTRAPIEFAQGAFPNAQSLPLMSDEQRDQVGTCYKNKGQEQAIQLGHELVQGDIKQERRQRKQMPERVQRSWKMLRKHLLLC